jgi:hypothetical protein
MDKLSLEKLTATAEKRRSKPGDVKIDKRLSAYIERYERLRNIVGFHDEQLWRRFAIQRIVKREILLSTKEKPRAEDLLQELVLGQYLDEEEVTTAATARVDAVIGKYLFAAQMLGRVECNMSRQDARSWLFGIMAIEIEEVLGLLNHSVSLADAMKKEAMARFQFPQFYITKEQEEIFTLIASAETLLKADQEFVAYLLIKRWYSAWFTENGLFNGQYVQEICALKMQITQYERHPLFKQIIRIAKPHSIVFLVLDEVIKKYRGDLTDLQQKCRVVLQGIYSNLERKVRRQVWYSFLYLLLTKFILVLVIEFPYEKWRYGSGSYFQAGVNLGSPVLLLLILTVGIRVSTERNTKTIIKEVENLVLDRPTELESKLTVPRERAFARSVLFNLFFAVAYFLSYGAMVFVLRMWHFNIVSGCLFVFFITLVTYLAIRIRFTAERFRIIEQSRLVGREILYFIALPILSSGKWIVGKFSRYNFIIMLFDLFFEAPYKTIVFLFRDFSDFAREMREKIE